MFHLYINKIKKKTNITKQKQTHRYNEQTSGSQRGGCWGDKIGGGERGEQNCGCQEGGRGSGMQGSLGVRAATMCW